MRVYISAVSMVPLPPPFLRTGGLMGDPRGVWGATPAAAAELLEALAQAETIFVVVG